MLWWSTAVIGAIVVTISLALSRGSDPKIQLSDGRLLQVEAVTFGLHHQVGSRFCVRKEILDWLSAKLHLRLPLRPLRKAEVHSPTIMVWVNALTNVNGGTADCGGLEVAFVDNQGVRYRGLCNSMWSGGGESYAGYWFEAYPRSQRTLTLEVASSGSDRGTTVVLPNPHIVTPARWSGAALPQTKRLAAMEVYLLDLSFHSNAWPAAFWPGTQVYWEPLWELRKFGRPATGWDPPDWIAEDPLGNRCRHLGTAERVLSFEATYYPNVTNCEDTILIATSPLVALDHVQTNFWWNLEITCEKKTVKALGLFPPGRYVFFNHLYQTNPAPWMNPNQIISGWTGGGRSIGAGRHEEYWAHQTSVPTVYLQVPDLPGEAHVEVRIRDQQGRLWPAKAEPCRPAGACAYLVEVGADVNLVRAEIVLARPVRAQFFVDTRNGVRVGQERGHE